MNRSQRIDLIANTVESLGESMRNYETAQEEHGLKHVYAGYSVDKTDSRTSILRKITFAREQLLVLARDIKGDDM